MSGLEQLLRMLNSNQDLALRRYEQLRNRLMMFFNHRGYGPADHMADETLDRLAAKLVAGAELGPGDFERYAVGIARNVWQESGRKPLNSAEPIEDPQTSKTIEIRAPNTEPLQRLVDQAIRKCKDKCLSEILTEQERWLILEYYKDDWHDQVESRKRIAETLGISADGLRTRSMRILKKLNECARKCLDGK
jgi:RNA polymerase sigma factor (sigma-70 family)